MREDRDVPSRFTPATPRSKRLGRELRRLRDAKGWNLGQAATEINSTSSRLSRIESGDIRPRPGAVMELLHAYGIKLDDETAVELLALARAVQQVGWWQRLDAISNKYATFIAYEAEAIDLQNFEPTLIPGLLQTEEYARAVVSVGRETDAETIEQLVQTRMTRQEVLRRSPKPLRLHAILSEAALSVDVGGQEVMRDQLMHIVELGKFPNVTVQVLRFAAGAHLATKGSFQVLLAEADEPPLGYIETLAGELFLEAPKDIVRLLAVYDNLKTLAMSPAESIRFIRERARSEAE